MREAKYTFVKQTRVAWVVVALTALCGMGCGPSDEGSIDLLKSKSIAEKKGIGPGGSGGNASESPKRSAVAPKTAPTRPMNR